MKFSPIIVTTLAIFSIGIGGCQRKTAKDAAAEGNQLSQEASVLNAELRTQHDVNCYDSRVSTQSLESKASSKDFSSLSPEQRGVIRGKLNQLVAKIDRIFQIDKRKDIRINDKSGSFKIARDNALLYLASLDRADKKLANVPKDNVPKEDPKKAQTDDDSGNSQGYGWGGLGNRPTLQ